MECTLYLTDDCNLQCSYCYEGDKKNKSYMTEATLEKTLDFIVIILQMIILICCC